MSDPIRVLLVEDSEDDAALIRRALSKAGMDLSWTRVDDEARFLNALHDDWDVIISDFLMPRFDGLRAFSLYRERDLDVPFIFVSGALGEERAVEAMRVGARDYILKGNLARLAVAVEREIASAESRAAQRRAQKEAQREQRRLAIAVEASGAGVFEHSVPLGGAAYCTERCAEILGYEADEVPLDEALIGFITTRLDPEDREDTLRGYEDFIMGAVDRFDREIRLGHRDGYWVEAALSAKAVRRRTDGRASHVVGVLLDISERRRLEAQLMQAQKMEAIGRLAGGVAHDFNNILAVILTAGTLVLETLDPEGPARDDMDEVLRAARRAGELTSQLLAFSRTKPVSPRTVNINRVILELDRMLQRLLGEDVTRTVSLAEDLWNVRIDPGSLEHVITNLAVNARDAMPNGGTLTMETRNVRLTEARVESDATVPPGDYVVIAISDDGEGMDKATQGRIFEPFFTTKAVGRGTGLGLSTCYGVVKQARGFIWCRSAPGRGTTFVIQLPRVFKDVDDPEGPVTEPSVQDGGGESILVVEDDAQVRQTLTRLLDKLGYAVTAIASGPDALTYCEGSHAVDLLLTDFVMPGMNGIELSAQARVRRPGLKVLLMSGYAADRLTLDSVDESRLPVLEKPFSPASVGLKVRQVLDQ